MAKARNKTRLNNKRPNKVSTRKSIPTPSSLSKRKNGNSATAVISPSIYATKWIDSIGIYIFCILMMIASVWFSRQAMDWTHVPRMFALSIGLIISTFFLKWPNKLNIRLDIFLIAYWLYFLFYLASISWATNLSEGILDTTRIYLGLIAFLFTVSFFNMDRQRMEHFLPFIGFVIIISGIFVTAYQAKEFPKLTIEAIYLLKGLSGHKNLYAAFNLLALSFCVYGAIFLKGDWKYTSVMGSIVGVIIIVAFTTFIIRTTDLEKLRATYTTFSFFESVAAFKATFNIRKFELLMGYSLLGLSAIFYFFKGSRKFLCILASILSFGVIVFLQTRASWVGLFATLFVLLAAYTARYKSFKRIITVQWLLVLIGSALALGVIGSYYTGGLSSIVDRLVDLGRDARDLLTTGFTHGGSGRMIVWQKTYKIIEEYWLLGVGSGNWKMFFSWAGLENIGTSGAGDNYLAFQRPHNDYLWVLSETGIFGFLFYMTTIVYLLYKSTRLILKSSDSDQVIAMTIYLSFYVGYLTMAFFDFPKERPSHIIFSNILMGIIYCRLSAASKNKTLTSFSLPTKYLAIVPMLGLFVFATSLCHYRIEGEHHTAFIHNIISQQGNEYINRRITEGNAAYHPLFYTVDPTSNPIHYYIASGYLALKQYEKAQELFEIGYKHNPYSSNLLINMGICYNILASKKPEKQQEYSNRSIDLLKEAVRISPITGVGRSALVQALYAQQRYEEAKEYAFNETYPIKNEQVRTSYQNAINYQLQQIEAQKAAQQATTAQ